MRLYIKWKVQFQDGATGRNAKGFCNDRERPLKRRGDQCIFGYLIFVVIVLSLRATSYSVEVLSRVTLVK